MANSIIVAGAQSYLIYGSEATYNSAGTLNQVLGLVQSFGTSHKNNLKLTRGMKGSSYGGRAVFKSLAGRHEETFSIEFTPIVFDFLEYVLHGTKTGSGTGADPYVYSIGTLKKSITLSYNIDNDTTDSERVYTGCVVNSMTVRASVDEPISVSLDVIGATLAKDSTITSAVSIPSTDPYSFVGGSIEIPNASAISNIIDSVEITINNNAEVLYGLGSRTGQEAVLKELDITFRMTLRYLDDTMFELLTGSSSTVDTPTESATAGLRFANGANKYVDFVFSNVTFENLDENNELNQVMNEDITARAETVQVTEQQSA